MKRPLWVKMGRSIQFERHRDELPFVYLPEQDSSVLEFYDQPDPIKLTYASLAVLISSVRPSVS